MTEQRLREIELNIKRYRSQAAWLFIGSIFMAAIALLAVLR